MSRRSVDRLPPRATRKYLRAVLLLAGLTLAGCPEGSQAKPKSCTATFEQCQLPDGPLGVCQETSCNAGQVAPCFRCVSQH